MTQEEFGARFGDPDRSTFILTRLWTPGKPGRRHIEVLKREAPHSSGFTFSRYKVRGAIHPKKNETEWITEVEGRGGEPISYSYCEPLNKQELRRAVRWKRHLLEKRENNHVSEEAAAHKAGIQFYTRVTDHFLYWYDLHENVDIPNFVVGDDDPSSLTSEQRRFIKSTRGRRRQILQDLLPNLEALDDYPTLRSLAEKVLYEEESRARKMGVVDMMDLPTEADSVARYFREHVCSEMEYALTPEQRKKAICHWAHGREDELDKMEGRI